MTNPTFPVHPFEQALGFDPAQTPDATLAFVGAIRSPWHPGHCPKNLREARALGGVFAIDLLQSYRASLLGLVAGQSIIVVTWLGSARRDLIQQHPSHRAGPTGTFALRSPIRPNPIGLAVVRLLAIDAEAGRLTLDAIDMFDATPVLDIKPFLPSVDIPPEDRP